MTKKKVADGRAKIVFYGVRTISSALGNRVRYKRNFVSVAKPDIVVTVILTLKDNWYQSKKRIDIDEKMNSLAKRYFPKAECFMFYNKVTFRGIPPPPQERSFSQFTVTYSL